MEYLNPDKRSSLVYDFFTKFLSNFNEASLAFFIRHKVLLLVDINPGANKERQLQRGEGGDPHRARLPEYSLAQIVYLFFGKLVGWKHALYSTNNCELAKSFFGPAPEREDFFKKKVTRYPTPQVNVLSRQSDVAYDPMAYSKASCTNK